ncbi:SDR family NAD(P)-dependent oxidoreductase [Seonamhaeicola marinus]|uniref:SDR family NAD(P)-dependent oxidoreductase n=1 Tax=Seonamhaeicola marinus TaxID=1912246 RepID=A0A5D0HRF2_9FLAO|nr:SDR family NAD(P)-dependent oxidoreductase [Seonamhaeicola marinus]TYA71962.1 SDR family NAD(P)-dependent oxidoreductase [Seonamhaeicola marinus]
MKTILITGSTDGIGKLTAIKLAKDGHQVFIHGRNSYKLETVISEIKEETGNNNIAGFIADFSDIKQVKSMVKAVNQKLSKIDVLINNAGVFKSSVASTVNGLDIRYAVNYYAPYVLTLGVLPLLEKAQESRVVNLSSAAQAAVTKGAVIGKVTVPVSEAYAQSKLALTMWSFYLAKTIKNPAIIAVNPGSLLNTNMVKEAYGHHWSSADKGASILYELAVSEEFKAVTGVYFDNDRGGFNKAHPDAYNSDKINDLIGLTNQIVDNI